jgi:hypothetical protein
MISWRQCLAPVAAAFLFVNAQPAAAAQVRFHFAPTDLCGRTALKPGGCGAPGERLAWFGLYREAYQCVPRPTHFVTFRHPYTGQNVTVPFSFPEGTPRIEYRGKTIIYNYGSYTVEAHFFPDGSVDAVYNSGLFRLF